MKRQRNAKIIATLGPSSSDPQVIRQLFDAGVDVFRLNFSHGTQSDHLQRLTAIRALERESGRPIGVLLDLQGPKLRLGTFEGGSAELLAGEPFRLDMNPAAGTCAAWETPVATTTRRAATASPPASRSSKPDAPRSRDVTITSSTLGTNRRWKAVA